MLSKNNCNSSPILRRETVSLCVPIPLHLGNYVLVLSVSIVILKTALSELFLSVLLESKKGIMSELEER